MSFTITKLQGSRAVVSGTDRHGTEGKTILNTTQWDEMIARDLHEQAHDAYDQAVEAFYAPLVEAAAKIEQSHFTAVDPLSVIVHDEGEEATAGRAPVITSLTKDSQVLRLIESGNTDRLIWVGDSLEITAYEAPAVNWDVPTPADPWADLEARAGGDTQGSDSDA